MRKTFAVLTALALSMVANAADKPKNIIMIIGDGMGPSYTSAYRYYMDNQATEKVESTIFDQLLVGMASTYSTGTQENHTRKTYVTDSAAAATALSTGVKTYNQAVGQDVNDKPLQTIMQYAKSIGKTTGIVVTSQINHATPASFVAQDNYRYHYDAIADDFYDNRVDGKFIVDLMLGGGKKYFIRDDRNIAAQFKKAGYQYYDQFEQLSSFDRLPALGIFAEKSIGFAIDSPVKYRLRSMVEKALQLMDSPKNNDDNGYFLLVEASLIDWCGHNNDIACAMHEVDDLAKTAEYIKGYVDNHPDTLMVMTADHSTGGLSIGSNDVYNWKTDIIKQIKHSAQSSGKLLLDNADAKTIWQQRIGIDISDQQMAAITQVQKQLLKKLNDSKSDPAKHKKIYSDAVYDMIIPLANATADNTLTGWTTIEHTGGDVQVFAHGHSKSSFSGHQDNTDIAKKLFQLIK